MRLSIEFYNQLRDHIPVSDIVRQKVSLTRKGAEYLGVCPFHNEKTPSFTVNDIKKFYHCFGCGAHGDVIRFVGETSGISYKDAALKLAGENGIEIPKLSKAQEKLHEEIDEIYHILELASQFFTSKLSPEIKGYLATRGVNNETINNFAIGYAPGNRELEKFFKQKSFSLKDLLRSGLFGKREDGKIYEVFNKRIIFPIKNTYNKIIAFGGRAIGDTLPKYINSPETIIFKKSETLFGENVATSYLYRDNYSILVEGYMDVIALHQSGFKHALASLGTSVTETHIHKLWRSCDEIIACLDGDNAGIRARNRMMDLTLSLVSPSKLVSFIELPAGLDPDDVIKSGGANSFEKLLKNRIGLSQMIWKKETQNKIFKTAEARAILENKLESYCALIKDHTLKTNFRRYFKEMIWENIIKNKKASVISESQINNEFLINKNYTEVEFTEYAICAFIMQFPDIAHNYKEGITLSDQSLNDFKDWILDTTGDLSSYDNIILEQKVKNTRFYNTYLLLSNGTSSFINYTFLKKETTDLNLVFELLCKKHYLSLLKQEYAYTFKDNITEHYSESRSYSYLKEIQKVSKEIVKLSEIFIN